MGMRITGMVSIIRKMFLTDKIRDRLYVDKNNLGQFEISKKIKGPFYRVQLLTGNAWADQISELILENNMIYIITIDLYSEIK